MNVRTFTNEVPSWLGASLEDFERYVRICNPVISDVGPADIAAYLKYAEEVVLTSS